MTRRLVASLFVAAVAFTLWAHADQAKPKPSAALEEAALKQERLARQFRDFESALLRLAQRMEQSTNPEDREKAAILKKAIARAATDGVTTKFDRLIALLKEERALNLDDLQKARSVNKDLAEDIRAIPPSC
jgi:hypothetical protein